MPRKSEHDDAYTEPPAHFAHVRYAAMKASWTGPNLRSADLDRQDPGSGHRPRKMSHSSRGGLRLSCRGVSYPVQPSSRMAQPAFQILVRWLILPSWNSIT